MILGRPLKAGRYLFEAAGREDVRGFKSLDPAISACQYLPLTWGEG